MSIHAATGAGPGPYATASYDSVGDMTCRAPTSTTTPAGTQTGAQLTYDNERRLTHWQNTPSSPTTQQDDFRYDGLRHAVALAVSGEAITTVSHSACLVRY